MVKPKNPIKPVGKSPAFQFYPKDFLTDIKVVSMTMEVRGAYITLLCYDWLEDGIPEKYFNSISQLTDGSAIAQLLNCYVSHPLKEGFLTNPRLFKERKGQLDRRVERSESGKTGAKARWNRDLDPIAQPSSSNGTAINQPMAKNGSSSSSSSSTTSTYSSTPVSTAVLGAARKRLAENRLDYDHAVKSLKDFVQVEGEEALTRACALIDRYYHNKPDLKPSIHDFSASWLIKEMIREETEKNYNKKSKADNSYKPHTVATTLEKNKKYFNERKNDEKELSSEGALHAIFGGSESDHDEGDRGNLVPLSSRDR